MAAAEKQVSAKLALLRDRRVLIPLAAGGVAALLLLVVAGVMLMQPAAEPMSMEQPATAAEGTNASDPDRSREDLSGVTDGNGSPPALPINSVEKLRTGPEQLPPGISRVCLLQLPKIPGFDQTPLPSALAVSADNRYLAVGLEDGRLILLDLVEEKPPRITERAHPRADPARPISDATTAVAFSSAGNRVGWGTQSRHFAFADLADGALVWRSPVVAVDNRRDLDSPQVVLKDDDTMLIATSGGISELSTIDFCRPLNGGTPWQGMDLRDADGDESLSFVAHVGKGLAGRGPGRWPTKKPNSLRVTAICPDAGSGGLLVSGAARASLTVIALGGDTLWAREEGLPSDFGKSPRLVMPDCETAILAMSSQLVMLTGNGRLLTVELPDFGPPSVLSVDTKHKRAVVGSIDGSVQLISLEAPADGSAVLSLPAPAGRPACATISPDGTRILISRGDAIDMLATDDVAKPHRGELDSNVAADPPPRDP